MATNVNFENAKHADERTRMLITGFIRETAEVLDRTRLGFSIFNAVPRDLSVICLIYVANDRFSADAIGDIMGLYQKRLTLTGGFSRRQLPNSAFLSNVIDRGRYSWRFRLIEVATKQYWTSTIGIWKCRKGAAPPINRIFTLGEHVAYGFAANIGALVDPATGHEDEERPYGLWCRGGDIVEMHIDLTRCQLSFKINGVDYGKAFDIEKTAYRAAVNMSQVDDAVEIIE